MLVVQLVLPLLPLPLLPVLLLPLPLPLLPVLLLPLPLLPPSKRERLQAISIYLILTAY